MSKKAQMPQCLAACVLLCAAAWVQPGCKPKPASLPQSDSSVFTNSVLQTELDRLRELPLERDPARRRLILSKPAADGRQWALQALQQGYQAAGRTNRLWDGAVQRAFEAYADYTRANTTNWPALERALEGVPTDCDEPMIQYMRVRYREDVQTPERTAVEYLRAYRALARSQHHPVFKFTAGLRAEQAARTADKTTTRSALGAWTTADLQDLARDTNAPAKEVFDAATSWVEHSHTKAWIEYVTRNLLPFLERSHGETERWFRFRGRTEIRFAWGERGGGYANTVTDSGWEGFAQHLDQAEEFLTKAWQQNSNVAETAYLMMRVELGQGRGQPRMETWFNRAMSLNTNFYDAAQLMSFYLEPRWHGSEATALKFARSCVASKQWGGRVPLVLVDLHHSLARYHSQSNSPAYWQRPQVWRDVKNSYEKFFALNPDGVAWRHNYARDAYTCGQYSDFLEQTRLFTYGTNHAFFGGPEKFRAMLENAVSRSSGRSP